MNYILVDTANTFFRARHAVRGEAELKIGMALHTTFQSIRKAWKDFDGNHVVFCLEGRSWRKDFYEPYKKNRAVARQALTEAEQEEDKLFWEAFDSLTTFLKEKTNCSVLQCNIAEADDIIARWVHKHPNDEHCIVSSDTDFIQLLTDKVTQYNGITQELHTTKGIFDDRGNPVIDKKTKLPKETPNPQWLLFEKCMRGDTSDNVFSAFPGVRKKGTKNKVGLVEAFADRQTKGFNWNNLMLQRWVDHNGEEHRVLEDYERNKVIIDLTAQPTDIREKIDNTIKTAIDSDKNISQVGVRLMKFCHLYDLKKISDQAQAYAEPLNARYKV